MDACVDIDHAAQYHEFGTEIFAARTAQRRCGAASCARIWYADRSAGGIA